MLKSVELRRIMKEAIGDSSSMKALEQMGGGGFCWQLTLDLSLVDGRIKVLVDNCCLD